MESINISTDKFSKVHYRKAGSGPAIVLIHGFPADGDLWRYVAPVLADKYTVIVPDVPGSGQSSLDHTEISIEQLSDCIKAILNKENIPQAVIAGHSMGGYIALAFAEDHRSWLKGISLIHSTAAADTPEKKETRRKSIDLIRKGGKDPFVRQMVPNLFYEGFRTQHPDVISERIETGLNTDAESLIAFYNAMINRPDRTGILNGADFPVQWIFGKDDQTIPFKPVLPQTSLADVNFVSIYDDCAHMSMLEQPEKLAGDLQQFLVHCYNR